MNPPVPTILGSWSSTSIVRIGYAPGPGDDPKVDADVRCSRLP